MSCNDAHRSGYLAKLFQELPFEFQRITESEASAA